MTAVRAVDGAWVDYHGQRYHLERRQDHTMEWRCRSTLVHMVWTDAELQRKVASGEARFFSGIGRPPATGKASRVHGRRKPSELDFEEARRKLVYVLALREKGMPGADATPAKWQEVIDTTYEDQGRTWKRLRSRTHEIEAKPSLKSVRRWVAAAGDPPKLANLISRHRHKGNYEDRIDGELRDLIGDMVDEHYLIRPPITIDDLKDRIAGKMAEFNAKRAAEGLKPLPAPGLTAIQTSIDAIPKDRVLRTRYGEMAAFLRYGSAEAQKDPAAPLDRVELDATRLDLFVVDPDTLLPIGRPWLVVALDRCTRMVLGWFITFEPPSTLALMQALRNAILPKLYLDQIKEERGWVIDREPETGGVPRVLAVDRARENIAEHLARFAMRIGINRVEIMAGKKPWLKGAVEKVIGTITRKVAHPAKGTTFHNTLVRMGYDSINDAVCTPDDLDYGLHKFFIDIYPWTKHRGLNGRQPIKVWREKTDAYPVDIIGHIDDVAHLFGRTDHAKPGRFGINAHAMQYFSLELLEVQRSAAFQKALADQGGKLEFHTDPACIDMIHVRMPHEHDRVIPVPVAPKWREYARGLSLWHHRRIREFIRADASTDAAALLKAKLDLIEIMRGSALGKRRSIRASSQVARLEGVGRVAPAGNDARNTVPGTEAHASRPKPKPNASNDQGQIEQKATAQHLRLVDDDKDAVAVTGENENERVDGGEDAGVPTPDADGKGAPKRRKKGWKP
ncbi:integrase catalytic domain-containing protein [Sphingomonas beigongshangi]|uniref:integrase catalytic domain-containing protein n=1 Tax=Sphingomonas beigongshangi TaxID=2782540 RepID=UPI001AEE1E00|nr:DDE-type integrase/transposase/recombinase [Sphingomonas beigongshangi]